MREATASDKALVIDIISKSFDSNKSINYVIKQDAKRAERLKLLIAYSFFHGMRFGKIYLSDDHKGACILIDPNQKKTTLPSLLWDIKLAMKCVGIARVGKVLKRERLIQSIQPKDNFIHLWYIGVSPDFQGKSIGSNLLAQVLSKYDTLPFYLETSTASNLSFYKKFGFKVIHTIDLGYTLHIMKRAVHV